MHCPIGGESSVPYSNDVLPSAASSVVSIIVVVVVVTEEFCGEVCVSVLDLDIFGRKVQKKQRHKRCDYKD